MVVWRWVTTTVLLVVLAACGETEPPGPKQVLSAQHRAALATAPRGARIAIIDGGIDRSHPVLRDLVVGEWRAPGLPPEPSDHATQLAGIIAGRPTEAFGGGLAPGTAVLDGKALDASGVGRPTDVAAALRWSADMGADIVLTSLAMDDDDPEVRQAVARLIARGRVVVSASGNAFVEVPVYPASYPGVLSVSAHDQAGRRLQLAGWAHADVVAPGERVRAPTPPFTYQDVSGTSVAAAMAVGLLAACGDHQPRSESDIRGHWTNGTVTYGGRALPRLTCPGHDEEGER